MENGTLITSAGNKVIKLSRSLQIKKNREESGLFLVEGIHHVGSAIEARWDVSSIIYSQELLSSSYANQLVLDQIAKGTRCYKVTAEIFKSISEKENPAGILAIVHQRNLLIEDLKSENFKWGVAAITPQDPGNVGTILRIIDSVGADGLFLLNGGVDPFHPTSVRASMGAIFWKPVIQTTFDELISWSSLHTITLVGSSAHAENDFRKLASVKKPCILILGSEQKGMTREEMESCDLIVSIPMVGHSSSLNISVAAGILLYAMI